MIYVIEPQCNGYEHLTCNITFISLMQSIFPKKDLLFFANKSHAELLNFKLGNKQVNDISLLGEINHEEEFMRNLLKLSQQKKIEKIIFLSIGSSQAYYANKILKESSSKLYFFMHFVVSELSRRPSINPLNFIKWIFWTLFFSNKKSEFIVFSNVIAKNVNKFLFGRHKVLSALLPYDMSMTDAKQNLLGSRTMNFVFPGEGRIEKGILEFIEISRNYAENPDISFIVSGRMKIEESYIEDSGLDCIFSKQLLSEEEHIDRLAKADYFVLLHQSKLYKYIYSGVLLESVKSLKPIIALRNPILDEFFQVYGEIGYLVNDVTEIKDLIDFIYRTGDERRGKFEQNLSKVVSRYEQDTLESLKMVLK